MKRLSAIIISAVMALSVCACSVDNSSLETTTATTTESESKPSITAETTASAKPTNSTSVSSGGTTEKVKCSMCNGTGHVKYYYGGSALEAALNGQNDYEYGPCTSCNGTGYTTVKTSTKSTSNSINKKTCPSCGKKVSNLVTKKDVAGVSRTWCSNCWAEYNAIMGK